MEMWTIRSDGSFDLNMEPFGFTEAYPGIDGLPLRATSVSIHRTTQLTTITYALATGSIEIGLACADNVATLDATVRGMDVAPRSVKVIGGARPTGASRCFKQAHGMGGGSGLLDLKRGQTVESFGITALLGTGSQALVIFSADHTRFQQRCHIRDSHAEPGAFCLSAAFDTEGIPLAGTQLILPTLRFQTTTDIATGLRQAAESISAFMKARPPRPASYHWCSWYYLYQNLDMKILREYLDGFARLAMDRPLDYFQIDAGYAPSCGDWLLPSTRFPDTLKPAFEMIRKAGYRPAVWIGPFMVGNRSQLFKEHPDWILRDRQGREISYWRHYGEQRVWGYRDEETYILDTSHPEAFAYLRQVFRSLRQWGAEMFKTDFMSWGLHDSTQVRRYTPGKTGVEYFRDVLQMIREEIGQETFWLGCIAPYMPFVGYADAMRIGGDVGASWQGGFGPQNMLQETVGSQHFNNVFWQNDPDVILLRNFHIDLNEDEIVSLALWQALMGGVVATSDPLHEISDSRRALWQFIQPSRDRETAVLPLLTQQNRCLVGVRTLPSGDHCVLVFNPSDRPVLERIRFEELGMKEPLFGFARQLAGSTRLGRLDELLVTLRPHASQLFHLSYRDEAPCGPMLVGQ